MKVLNRGRFLCSSKTNQEDAMVFLLASGVIMLVVLTIPGLVKLEINRSKSRIFNADWLAVEDQFRIVSRWGAQY